MSKRMRWGYGTHLKNPFRNVRSFSPLSQGAEGDDDDAAASAVQRACMQRRQLRHSIKVAVQHQAPAPFPFFDFPPFVLLHIYKKLPCVPPFEILPNPKTLRLCSATVRVHKKGFHWFLFGLSRNVQTRPSMFCSVFYRCSMYRNVPAARTDREKVTTQAHHICLRHCSTPPFPPL